jgi:uncharacterized membrane-anchored protein
MNEQTTKLIEQLSQKLGTTTEHLWSVLLKQAQVSAIMNLILLIVIIVVGIVLYKLHKHFSKETSDYGNVYENNEITQFIMILSFIGWLVIMLFSPILSIKNIINGFFYPEYWALMEIFCLFR